MTNNFNNLIRKALKEYVKPSMSLCENVKISKDLKYHLDNKITLSENIFRGDSKNFFNLIKEVRSLYNKNLIKLNDDDCWIVESDLNKNVILENENLFRVYDNSAGVRVNGDDIDLSYFENIKKILQKLINRELIPKLIEQNKVYDDFTDLQINVKKILVAKNQDMTKNLIVIDIIPWSNITWGRVISGVWELLEILGISKHDFVVEYLKPTHNRISRLSDYYAEEYIVVENKQSLPFSEEIKDGKKIRTFLENVSFEELKWRFDNEDRIIRPLNETNWQYQSDNKLPILLENNKTIYIPKGKYHRLIKGSGELKVEISTKGTY